MTAPQLPPGVTATLADDGPDGWTVYRLADRRGYTHREDTIRVGAYNAAGDYRIERMTRDGWRHLAAGELDADYRIDHAAAILRAVAILYGMEPHG